MCSIPSPLVGAGPAPGGFPQADGAGTQGCGRSAPASETSIPRRPAAASAEVGTPTQHRPAHPPGCGQCPRRDAGDHVRELASGIGMGGHEQERSSPTVTTEHAARPSRRKILNHGKHGTTRKGDPNVFPFLCPSVLSVVITCLDNRCAAQRGRTLVERKDTERQG